EEARERWIQKQLDETGLKAMDFRNGMAMEIQPARELVAHWVGAARAMLGDAPNYTETPIEMEVKVGESPERFAFVLQRVGKLTPHQARQQAEERAKRAEAELLRSVNARETLCADRNAAEERARELEDRIAHLRDRWASCRKRFGTASDRAIAAEAALERVRAYAVRLDIEPHPGHDHVCPDDVRRAIEAALDEQQEH
ncbi:hypothetical protein ACGFY0_45305, partial [Streptomyces chartreusis]|uniref:hypothetical protein n=1 Tax=Streptomyces chartreusis TaxID=1969 RepID=UPI003716B135